jgi:hypothetical protein
MSRHRAEPPRPTRPRWGRVTLAGLAAVVTTTSLVGGAVRGSDPEVSVARDRAATEQAAPAPTAGGSATTQPQEVVAGPVLRRDDALPADSGRGRRVVFSESRQRVWLVGEQGVERTYLVSGSIYDNLDPGSYAVYSRSEDAVGIDDSGTMEWFVRFTRGDNAAIGFHDIPVADGEPVQGIEELGTPLSHGCIRQQEADALAMWDFAPIGTPVVVTA